VWFDAWVLARKCLKKAAWKLGTTRWPIAKDVHCGYGDIPLFIHHPPSCQWHGGNTHINGDLSDAIGPLPMQTLHLWAALKEMTG